MADARYVIDVILKAHDQTAGAFQKAAESSKLLNDAIRKNEAEVNKATEHMKRDYDDFEKHQRQQINRINENYKGSDQVLQNAARKQRAELKALATEFEDAHDRLAKSTQASAKAQQSSNKDTADGLERLRRTQKEVLQAEENYAKVLQRSSGLEKEVARTRAESARHAREAASREDLHAKALERATKAKQDYVRADSPAQKAQALRTLDEEGTKLGRLADDYARGRAAKERFFKEAGEQRALSQQDKLIRKVRDYEQAVGKARKTQKDLNKEINSIEDVKLKLNAEDARRDAHRFQRELQTFLRDVEVNMDIDDANAIRKLGEFEIIKQIAGRDIEVDIDLHSARARAELAAFNHQLNQTERNTRGLTGVLGRLSQVGREGFASMEGNVARFDNVMRGAFTLLIAFFLPQLVVLAGAAGGALLALGSSAAFAAGAIGGALVAGLGQALPGLGAFATAMSRVASVFKAVQQSNLLKQQQFAKAEKQDRASASAADAVRNATDAVTAAQDNLTQAHERVGEAQERVTEARKRAKREIEDLILAEKRANLSVKEAQDALSQAIQTGQAGEIQSRQLDLQEAEIRAKRAREDVGDAKRTGDDPSHSIRDAERGLKSAQNAVKDAEQAVTRARRGVEQARRSAINAGNASAAAAGKLAFLTSQMSKSERGLFNAMTRLQTKFHSFARTVSAPLIDQFTHATKRITQLLGDNRIVNAFKGLNEAMGTEFRKTFDTFTKGNPLKQMLILAKEFQRNLAPIGDILRNFGKAFLDIAVVASPALRSILDFIVKLSDGLAKFTSSAKGQKELSNFFSQGVVHLKAWVGLLFSIIKLFANIAGVGGGADTGLKLVKGLTKAINDFADAVGTKGSRANKFFKDLFKVVEIGFDAMGPIFKALGEGFAEIFGEEAGSGGASIKAFSKIVAEVLIPAFFDFLRIMIDVIKRIGGFIDKHPGVAKIAASILAGAVAFGVLWKGITLVFGPLAVVAGKIVNLGESFGTLKTKIKEAWQWMGSLIDRSKKVKPVPTGPQAPAGKPATIEKGAASGAAGGAAGAGAGAAAEGGFVAAMAAAAPIIAIVAFGLAQIALAFLAIKDNILGAGDAFKFLVEGFLEPFKEMGKAFKELDKATGGFLGKKLGPVFHALGDAAKWVWHNLGPIIKIMALLAIVTNPIVIGFIALALIFRLIGLAIRGAVAGVKAGIEVFKKLLGLLDHLPDSIKKIPHALAGIAKFFARAGIAAFKAFIGFIDDIPRAVLRIARRGLNIAGDVARFLGRAGRAGLNAFIDFIEKIPGRVKHIALLIPRALAGLAGKFANLAKDVASAFVDGFKNIGSKIIGGITSGAKGVATFAKNIVNGIIGLLNKVFKFAHDKFRIHKFGINVGFPEVKIDEFQKGGRIGSGYGGGDQQLILAEEGEHIWTKEEVAAAGGHKAVMAIRSLFGKAGQALGFTFAEGGAVGSKGGGEDVTKIAKADLRTLINIIDAAGDRAIKIWRNMWRTINRLTTDGENHTRSEFRSMARSINTFMDRAADSAIKQARRLRSRVLEHFEALERGVFKGFDYIGDATREALDAFGVKPPKLSVPRPKDLTRATGGWIGNAGERGRDAIVTRLGRGEAVLNWGQQKIVDSALWNQYGETLDTLFKRTKGYHAGGPEQPGFASGGKFSGPGGSGEGFIPVWNLAKRFGMDHFTGKIGHNQYVAGSNRVSEHFYGRALDMSQAGVSVETPEKDALANFIVRKLSGTLGQVIYHNRILAGSGKGGGVSGHLDHVHYGMQQQYAFNKNLMARIISRAKRGLSIADLLSNVSGENVDVEHVSKIIMKGAGVLKDLGQKVLNKVRAAANSFIDEKAGEFDDTGAFTKVDSGPRARAIFDFFVGRGLSQAGAAGIMGNLSVESGFRTNAPEGGFQGIAQWDDARWGNLVAFARSHGQSPFSLTAQLNFLMKELSGYGGLLHHLKTARSPSSAAYDFDVTFERSAGTSRGQRMAAAESLFRSLESHAQGGYVGQQFAEGGTVRGPGEGAAVPIIAHAGEWVLNKLQQSKLSQLLGVTTGRLRDFLGFTGGPKMFAGGGDILTHDERVGKIREGIFPFPQFPLDTFHELDRAFKEWVKAVKNIPRKVKKEVVSLHKQVDQFQDALDALTREGGLLDLLAARIERHTTQMATRLKRSQFIAIRPQGKGTPITGVRSRGKTEESVIEQEIEDGLETLNDLGDLSKRISAAIRAINRRIRRIRARIRRIKARKGPVTADEQKEIDALTGDIVELQTSRVGLKERLDGVKEAIATAMEELVQKQADLIRKQIEDAGRGVQFVQSIIRVKEALGQPTAALQQALIGQMKIQAQVIRDKLAEAKKLGDPTLIKELQDQLNELNISIVEAQAAALRAAIELALAAAARKVSQTQIAVRILAAMGRSTIAAQEKVIKAMQAQAAELQKQIAVAKKAGNEALVKELEDQLGDLQASIIEAQMELSRAIAQEAIEAATRRQTSAGLVQRLAQAIGASTVSAQKAIINALQNLAFVLQQQIIKAQQAGNVGLAKELIDQLADVQVQIVEAQQELVRLQIEQIQKPSNLALAAAQITQRIAQALGQSTLATQQAIINVIKQQIIAAQKALQLAVAAGNITLTEDLQQQIADLQASLIEAQQALVKAIIDENLAIAQRATTLAEFKLKIAETLGHATLALQQGVVAAIQNQIAVIQTAIAQATTAGNAELVLSLKEQLQGLQGTLLDAQQKIFQIMIDEVNRTASRAQFQIDLRNRLADLLERGGDAIGAAQVREQILAAHRVDIQSLIAGVQSVLNTQLALPINQQNLTLIDTLNDQLDDLNVQLQENTLALTDAANATRDATLAQINSTAAFQSGVFNNLNQILQQVATMTSGSTEDEQRGILEQIGDVLATQGAGLRTQLLNWIGVDLLGLTGTEFVAKIAALDWQTLESGMTAAQKSTFEALINAIIENELQLEQNTAALDNLADQFTPQDFASTAWSWFRAAVFSGTGQLLPQFEMPGLQEGGTVLRTGAALVHEGEWVINPTRADRVPLSPGDAPIQLTVNEAGGPVDVEHLMARLQWERRGRRR